MPERWRTELQRVDRLHPDDDLVEKAMARPLRPDPRPSSGTKVATITIALILPIAAIYAAFVVLGGRGPVTPAADDSASAARTNGDLLYAKRVNDGWSLFALDPETGLERQITQGYRDYGSDWSPDGTKIVYDSESPDEQQQGIWVANADGSGATKLVDDGSVPAWSPDGTTIVFARAGMGLTVSYGEGSTGTPFFLYVMDADGTHVERLTDGQVSDYSPAWSPDGTQIAFVRYGREGAGLFVMHADGSDVRQVGGQLKISGAPDWSPDGASIAVAVDGTKGGPPSGIMLLPADGSGEGTMIPGTEVEYPDYVTYPAWSPDGEWIAYVHGYRGGLVIVHPDGSDERALHVDPGTDSIEELAWGAGWPSAGSPSE